MKYRMEFGSFKDKRFTEIPITYLKFLKRVYSFNDEAQKQLEKAIKAKK